MVESLLLLIILADTFHDVSEHIECAVVALLDAMQQERERNEAQQSFYDVFQMVLYFVEHH